MSEGSLSGGAAGRWAYECLPRDGRCEMGGADDPPLRLELRLESRRLDAPPDVCEVQAWFDALVATPTTVEKAAAAAHREWGLVATARGTVEGRHGTITFTVGE
jgi:hypothetical protein